MNNAAATVKQCSWCGKEADHLEWFPFALYLCPICADQKRQEIEEERRAGKVCSSCGKPYSLCVC